MIISLFSAPNEMLTSWHLHVLVGFIQRLCVSCILKLLVFYFVCVYLDLFDSRPLEAQIEAVVGQWPDLLVVAIVAHADDGNLWIFDQANHLLQEAKSQRSVSGKCDVQNLFKQLLRAVNFNEICWSDASISSQIRQTLNIFFKLPVF